MAFGPTAGAVLADVFAAVFAAGLCGKGCRWAGREGWGIGAFGLDVLAYFIAEENVGDEQACVDLCG